MLKVEEKDAVKGLLCVMQLDDKIWYRAQVLIKYIISRTVP
jgi:hypothetical protein